MLNIWELWAVGEIESLCCRWLCIQKRHILEDSNQLDARRSALDDDLEDMEEDEEEGEFKVSFHRDTRDCCQFSVLGTRWSWSM